MNPESACLRQYAETGDEAAFAEVVRQHLRLVYATALRRVNGDAALAEDVTQEVFSDLARKAAELSGRATVAGWLHRSAHYAATKAVRAAANRRKYEQEAAMMHEPTEAADIAWGQMRPWLDEAVEQLKEGERDAVVLRFFADKSHREVGEALGLSENTARMRVERGLEKMRRYLTRRGVSTSAALLATTLGAHAAEGTIPAGLAATVTGQSLASAAAGGGTGGGAAYAAAAKWLAVAGMVAAAGGWAWIQRSPAKPAAAPLPRVLQAPPAPTAGMPAKVSPPVNPPASAAPVAAAAMIGTAAALGAVPAVAQAAPEEPSPPGSAAEAATESTKTEAPPEASSTPGPKPISYKNWSEVAAGKMKCVRGAAWLGGQFVLVGIGPVLTSPDGLNWTEHGRPGGNELYAITANEQYIVAVGAKGMIITSRDLDSWTPVDTGTDRRFYSVCWTGAQFTALGDNGTVATSPDGEQWNVHRPASANYQQFHGGIWNGTKYVATSYNGILHSQDAENWTLDLASPPRMFDVAWSGQDYVAVGSEGNYLSENGEDWRATGDELAGIGHVAIRWTGEEFVTVGGIGEVDSSRDGKRWLRHPMGQPIAFQTVVEHDGILVIGTTSGRIFTNQKKPEGK